MADGSAGRVGGKSRSLGIAYLFTIVPMCSLDSTMLRRVARHPIRSFYRRDAFTLVEALASMGVVTALLAMLLPAIQVTRESAQAIFCRNNLRQIALALHEYESVHTAFPPTFVTTAEQNSLGNGASWSVHGRLLPHLEQSTAYDRILLEVDWHDQVESGVTALRIPTFLCPAEPNTRIRLKNGKPYVAPHTYGVNFGTWFVYDPKTDARGDGAFVINRGTRSAEFRDGLSNTLAVAEVKAYQPYLRNTKLPSPVPPISPTELAGLSGQFKETGHSVWPDGRVHHSGVTTTFAPNFNVRFRSSRLDWDIDFTSQQEGKSAWRPTYAAITSRSYHAGLVNIALMDGSARSASNSIDVQVWRALGTRGGGEVLQGF